MKKDVFFKLKPKYNEQWLGSTKIRAHTVDSLPEGVNLIKDINHFINYKGYFKEDEVYFAHNIEGKYYLEITTKSTNIEELKEYIELGLIYA